MQTRLFALALLWLSRQDVHGRSDKDIAQLQGGHGYRSSLPWLPRDPVDGAVSADQMLSASELPQHFDWRNVSGQSFVVSDWMQHTPVYCGSCWIHGTLSALSDRIKLMRGAAFPDVRLGRQSVMNCVPDPSKKGPPPGCDGGDAWMIHAYMHKNPVPDETCMPYQARNMGCTPDTMCRNCYPFSPGCFAVNKFIGYGVRTYGNLSGEQNMMKEIFARGPIACSFATDLQFLDNFSEIAVLHEGVYVSDQKFNESQIDHVMEVTGWGETASGLKYWVIRNSWGSFWGEAGWLKLRRGHNDLLGESQCDWAIPTIGDLESVLEGRAIGDYARGLTATGLVKQFALGDGGLQQVQFDKLEVKEANLSGLFNERWLVVFSAGSFFFGVLFSTLASCAIGRGRLRSETPLLG